MEIEWPIHMEGKNVFSLAVTLEWNEPPIFLSNL